MGKPLKNSQLRLFLKFLVVMEGLLILLGGAITYREKEIQVADIAKHELSVPEYQKRVYETVINSHLSDAVILVKIIQDAYARNNFDRTPPPGLINAFRAIIENKKDYDQVRLIGLDGQEIIRVDRDKNSQAEVVPPERLQNKGQRYYFKKGLAARGVIYVSRLDLNLENGRVERPLKPMIRLTFPVEDPSGRPRSLIVLNILGRKLIDLLSEAETKGKLYLVNDRGQWLKGPSPEVEWLFMFQDKVKRSFALDYPRVWQWMQKIVRGQMRLAQGLFTFNSVDLTKMSGDLGRGVKGVKAEGKLFIISFVPRGDLTPDWFKPVLGLLLLLACLIGYLAWYLAGSITRRARSVAALTENEKRLQTVTDSVVEAIIMVDSSGRVAFWNRAAESIFGFTAAEVLGQDVHRFITPKDLRTSAARGLENFSQSGAGPLIGRAREVEALRKDGRTFPAMLHAEDGEILTINKVWENLTGYKAAGLTSMEDWINLAYTDNQEVVRERVRSLFKLDKKADEGEIAIRTKDGRTIYWVFSSAPLGRLDDGRAIVISMAMDITSQKHYEDKLRQSEHRLLEAQSIAGLGNWEWNIKDDSLNWSDEVFDIFGLEKAGTEVNYETFLSLVHPDDRSAVQQSVETALETKKAYDLSHRIVRRDGTVHYVRERGRGHYDEQGDPIRMIGTVQDITKIKQAEEVLEKSRLDLEQRVAERTRDLEKANQELHDKVAALEKAELQLKILSLAIEQSPSTVIITDLDGKIEYANPSFSRVTGFSMEEALGKTPRIMKSGHHDDDFYKELWDRISSGEVWRGEIYNRKKNGEFYWELASISPVKDLKGRFTHYVAVKDDISDRKSREEELRAAKEAADIANQAKSNFLANMSHEIRTPLNAIIGLAHLSKRTDLSPKQLDYLIKIDTSAQSLLALLNDILDLSKVEAGRLDLEETDFSLEALLHRSRNLFSPKITSKGLVLHINVTNEVPLWLRGDPLRLSQVLNNLIGNAVKFTELGQISISVDCRLTEKDSVLLEFSVQDTGIGLRPEDKDNLFKAFSQADSSTTRQYGGTGLGLAISRQIVQLMGGEIWVDSEPGVGSRFAFTARFKLAEEKTSNPKPRALEHLRVLVVDDEETILAMVKEMITIAGGKPMVASTGDEALRACREQPPEEPYQVVLVDWNLGEATDGLELISQIKENWPTGEPPKFVLMSGYLQQNIQQAIDEGLIDAFLSKPFTSSSLMDTLRTAAPRKLVIAAEPSGGSMEIPTVPEALRGSRILLVEDNAINQQVASEILQNEGFRITIANNGQEALNKLRDGAFEVVLMDIQMPIMDGYEATTRIRQERRFDGLPIIAMSAFAMASDRQKSEEVGMNDHVSKPIQVDELIAKLIKWIKPREAKASKERPGPDKDRKASSARDGRENRVNLPDSLPGIEIQKALLRLGGNRNLLLDLLLEFRKSFTAVGPALEKAVTENDTEFIRLQAHTVKGVAGNIGAVGLQSVARELEVAAINQDRAAIESNLRKFNLKLAAVKQALADLEDPAEGGARPRGPGGDKAELAGLLDELEVHLAKRGALQCSRIMAGIMSKTWPGELNPALRELAGLVDRYNFKEAESRLASIKDEL